MKTIGLIGGISWVSTLDYYRLINQMTNERLGGMHSAKILLYSLNFEESKPPTDLREWGRVAEIFSNISLRLETAGADCILLCANTPHIVADVLRKTIRTRLIHIAEETAKEIESRKIHTVGLLGTGMTMEQEFFKIKLLDRQIATLVPPPEDREFIHNSIFNELGRGIFSPTTKDRYRTIMDQLVEKGAEGIILGCTEIPLLIKQEDCSVPVFDTTFIHARAAVDFACGETRVA